MKSQRTLRYDKRKVPGRYGVRCSVNRIEGSFPLHHHNYIEIEYLTAGRLQHLLNNQSMVSSAGDCWCLDNRDLHTLTVLEPVKIHNISIDLKTVPEGVRQFLAMMKFPMTGHLPDHIIPLMNDLFEKLIFVTTQDLPFSKEKTVAYLLLLLTHIFEQCTPLEQKPNHQGYEHIAKAVEFISQNYASPLTLDQVAKQVHLSPNYFSKLFCEANGYGFLEYLTFIRISKAKELLAATSLAITYIAFECGFGSFSTFSRTFKKQTGYTPSQYRQQKQKLQRIIPQEKLF